ncbi:hypothetical protein [Dickeya fangzhongdai]|uniref:hypothetical protein n=1 Tax=Dickeya fangzhongdai TaxID=1778540 RepID=UPI000B22056C|nr:hypothetical protein [Dickeya fangzhongdai]WKV52021.1 hypothetical protein PL145_07350 [Dickeya fangzhongdai]
MADGASSRILPLFSPLYCSRQLLVSALTTLPAGFSRRRFRYNDTPFPSKR